MRCTLVREPVRRRWAVPFSARRRPDHHHLSNPTRRKAAVRGGLVEVNVIGRRGSQSAGRAYSIVGKAHRKAIPHAAVPEPWNVDNALRVRPGPGLGYGLDESVKLHKSVEPLVDGIDQAHESGRRRLHRWTNVLQAATSATRDGGQSRTLFGSRCVPRDYRSGLRSANSKEFLRGADAAKDSFVGQGPGNCTRSANGKQGRAQRSK